MSSIIRMKSVVRLKEGTGSVRRSSGQEAVVYIVELDVESGV